MLLPLIIVLVFGSVVSFVMAMMKSSPSTIETRIQDFRTRATVAEDDEMDLSIPFAQRVLKPSIEGMARAAGSVLPASVIANIEKQLVMAGGPISLNAFLATWAICFFFMTGFVLFAVITVGATVGPQQAFAVLAFGCIGLMLPRLWLKGKVKARQKLVIRALPDALDMITTCVEAGLGLDAALTRVAEKSSGPLAEEIYHTLRDVAMGKLRRDALAELTKRLEIEEVTNFINSVLQAEQLGVGIAQVLRVQSDQLRMRRRQKAEKKAHEATIKMMFPLVLFIFPAFMLVILGPAIIRIADTLAK